MSDTHRQISTVSSLIFHTGMLNVGNAGPGVHDTMNIGNDYIRVY